MRKFNWGQKMIFFAIIFMLMVVGLVAKMMGHSEQLVDENYYEKGLQYQKELDAHKNLNYHLEFIPQNQQIIFASPDADSVKLIAKRPSNAALDFSMTLVSDGNQNFIFPTDQMAKGLWNIHLEWITKGNHWAADQKINIP